MTTNEDNNKLPVPKPRKKRAPKKPAPVPEAQVELPPQQESLPPPPAKVSAVIINGATDQPLSPEETVIINKLIESSMKAYQQTIADEDEQRQKTRDDVEALQHIVSEFLNDFIIIGHTVSDRRVVIRNAKTPGDIDKLSELTKRVLIKLMTQEEGN